MQPNLPNAFVIAYERLVAWSEVLDQINVFPVADGDTGRNLMISLASLRHLPSWKASDVSRQLLFSAKGNSGNIAAQFLVELLKADSFDAISRSARAGAASARKAVAEPRDGTILTVLDQFSMQMEGTANWQDPAAFVETVIDRIQASVCDSPEQLPELKSAGVVDAGGLGMFIFLEGFLRGLCHLDSQFRPIQDIFREHLRIAPSFDGETEDGCCIDFVVRLDDGAQNPQALISNQDGSAQVHTFQDYAKVHVHAENSEAVRQRAQRMGRVIRWSEDDLGRQTSAFNQLREERPIHIVTDAAGSITREMARNLGVSLLESYVTVDDTCMPETCMPTEDLYRRMRSGSRASTSQASVFERHQHYMRLLNQHPNVLYLCVGSIYTGNCQTALGWNQEQAPERRMHVIDTGAASGRLAVIVIATARYAAKEIDPNRVLAFAQDALARSREYIFLDELKYLAAGGRMSKTGAFFGNMLHMKPVISPTAEGAQKAGIVRNADAQIRFAIDSLKKDLVDSPHALVMLEYSDNREWVEVNVLPGLKTHFPLADIILQPLSLTSGVHIGPGAWAVAYMIGDQERKDLNA
ncbi:MAG: DegV family protein [Thermodesulfobacteriota bacterium]